MFGILDLIQMNPKLIPASKISFTGFGCIRIGNKKFAKWVESLGIGQNRRVVHSRDIITKFFWSGFGFMHLGTFTLQ